MKSARERFSKFLGRVLSRQPANAKANLLMALARLGHVLGQTRYLSASERTLNLFFPSLSGHPGAFSTLLSVLDESRNPPTVAVLRGSEGGLAEWQSLLRAEYLPHLLRIAIPSGLGGLPPTLDKPAAETVNAWVCQGVKCLPAISNPEELRRVSKHRELV